MNAQLAKVLRDFARTMGTDFPIQAILDHLVDLIVEIMPIDAAGVTLISPSGGSPRYIAASSSEALRFEELQSSLSEGPCLAAFRTDAAVLVPDLATDARFASFAPEAVDCGLRAVFAFPLRHEAHPVLGALDLYRESPGRLSAEEVEVAQTLADVAAAYILNAQAREDLKEASERYREGALHDALTGLPNRILFGQLLSQASRRTKRSGLRFAVLFADLDRFKDVNDEHGHQAGDELLRAVAARLATLVRPEDTLARLSGDEFIILCEGIDVAADVEALADRIVTGMHAPFTLGHLSLTVTASVGIAYSGLGDDVPDRLLRDADAAMYQAKRKGGARNQVLDLGEQERSEVAAGLGRDLFRALRDGELTTAYQPIISMADGRVDGFEALLRWDHPERGHISPLVMIPLAEQSKMICDIGRWVLTTACDDVSRWCRSNPGLDALHIAVNVSAVELLTCDYVPMMERVIDDTGIDPATIVIEVTESVLIADPERARVVLCDLKGLGVRLALDDFGTGYSSLSYLQNFPVDIVKIDQSFVAKLVDDRVSERIVRSVVELAHDLAMAIVAEGIETADQFRKLAAIGCEYAQGYLFARPVAASGISSLLAGASTVAGGAWLPLPPVDLAAGDHR